MSERPSIRRMEGFLGELVDGGVFSSVVGLVATEGEIVWEGAAGSKLRPSSPRPSSPVPSQPPSPGEEGEKQERDVKDSRDSKDEQAERLSQVPLSRGGGWGGRERGRGEGLGRGIPAETSTRFDYASLTKPFMATLALTLDAEGVLPLATRIGDLWPQAHQALARRPLSDLLRHRSGLAGWTPLYERCRSVEEAMELIVRGGNESDLVGARTGTYSDLGYILWGRTAEIATATPLAELLRSRVLEPLGLVTIEPTPPGDWADLAESHMGTGMEMKLAAKQGFLISDLGPPPLGSPQDGNARFLIGLGAGGGVCGHAGLFGGARDLWHLAVEWLTPGRLLKPEGVAAALAGGGPFALGWWRRTLRNSAGRALPPTAFGITGFAGNSFWIDPDGRRVFVMLGSRLDPLSDVNRWRRRFNTAAARITLEFEREDFR